MRNLEREISEPDYPKAVNGAVETLLLCGQLTAPVSIFDVLHFFDEIRTVKYSDLSSRMRIPFDEFVSGCANSEYAMSFLKKSDKKYMICYNDALDSRIVRFTLAHELGHYLLGHVKDNLFSNREANCFARNLLCPVPFADAIGCRGETDYCRKFQVTPSMASVSVRYYREDFRCMEEYYYNKLYSLCQRFNSSGLPPAHPSDDKAYEAAEQNWLYGFVG